LSDPGAPPRGRATGLAARGAHARSEPTDATGTMRVLIPGALRSYTRESPVEGMGDTLAALFADLDRRFPGLRFRVVDERDLLRPNMRIFVNGTGVRDLATALRPGDLVAIVQALSGG